MSEDDVLLKRLRDHQTRESAFRDLVILYQERIYWHVRKFVFEHQDANDIVQNTFMKAFRGLDGFKGNSKLFTWLYRIASNESITYVQKTKRNVVGDLETAPELEADSFFDGDQAQLLLHQAMEKLPAKQRMVFNMKYYDDMTYQQISEVLETSVGALKASFHHAVKKIEQHFKNVNV